MQGNIMAQEKEYILNESFKALLESIFSNPEQSQKLIKAFEEVVNDRATTQRLNFENLKNQAIEEIRQELVSKDLFQSEIKRLESLIYSEVARLEGIINTKIAEVKTEFSEQISSAKQKALYWLLGTAVATTVTILSSVWTMMNFMLENLK
ncbi:TPA: hypothetical protein R1737_001528 [Campylobacter lari]|uniref:hypothetical protein n=1 Tax=Campylobacter sp. IFREMER_LSEM_CL2194 TaxID=2911621 RepID=UPI0021E63FF3|nr:hypothetical protein [Campylobacter sp. IFREMER_LSEM_CL2194]MCV3386370.1 hypothetical protein [Campylobacter lari]MCV3377465.1 hypothetical protein [Campylobacter sp. IFREMER_LSEM_CL2194]MCV3405175.1 hypothetical protein [Campylobacter lari]MCV3476970.1 hypothetical protein [Campylobacter lari]HEC1783455.1 hypothetical protein [Campylobacter lari]